MCHKAFNQFVLYHVRIVSVLAGHFVNHVIAVHQRNHHHVMTKITSRKCFYTMQYGRVMAIGVLICEGK